ncbi:MAG: glycosyltransferase family 9 protein [Sphingobacteriia bacterium]|nr:glycosyltransferase family 9 protein [Sphingobacteriia bacterium]
MQNVLIFRQDHLGDLVLTTPLIRTLAESGFIVDVLARKNHLPVLENNPYINHCFGIEDIQQEFPKKYFAIVKWIRSKKYDLLVVPFAKPKQMGYVATVSGAKKKLLMTAGIWGRIGGNTCLRSNLLIKERHIIDVWLDFARYLRIEKLYTQPQIFITENELIEADKLINNAFGNDNKVIGVHPGGMGNTCNFPFSEYAVFVSRMLNETNYNIIITGNKFELDSILKWDKSIIQSPRVWVSAGHLNLRQLSAVIKKMDTFISSGTGPLHISNAVGSATFSPFCSRIGHTDKYWGNTNGNGGAMIVTSKMCEHYKKGNCKFEESCDANIFFEQWFFFNNRNLAITTSAL